MKEPLGTEPIDEHDWHSREYVDNWIKSDITRDDERRPVLRRMLAAAPFGRDAEISVLDVGAGYGLLSEEVLKAFPRSRVTMQDYSEPMSDHANRRLAALRSSFSYVMADLVDPGWARKVGGPFDLVVSGLAIHNLNVEAMMRGCYRSIRGLLRPGGAFLDYDLFGLVPGGVQSHSKWMVEAGFERTECLWEHAPVAVVAAWTVKASGQ
jgi:2-polyprenyl-3-methyl-5-hydroxy-6-metoxy-1,4-benzoquinol methylase